MKKLAMAMILLAAVLGNLQAGDYSVFQTPPIGMARGLINVCTSPLEIFRGPSYWAQTAYNDHSVLLGVDGAIFGVFSGCVMTVFRVSAGVLDVFTLGISGNYLHADAFPEFCWEDLWSPESWED